VKDYDTLFSLSNELNVPINKIIRMNKLKCENLEKN